MNNVSEEAVEWAKKRLKVKLSTKTSKDYALKYVKMRDSKRIPGTAINPRTRLVERAAARRCLAALIMAAYFENDQVKIAEHYELVLKIKAIADQNEQEYLEGRWDGKKQFRNTKKAGIQKLPDNWKEQICESMHKHRYINEVRILACIGCRPAEIEKGVRVHRKSDGIYFEVNGAKVDAVRGQIWRQIVLPLNHKIGTMIEDGLYSVNKKSISEIITRKAKKLGFINVSAYSFRHQFSSDLKASGESKKNIAMALGHQSEATQESYGNTGKGKHLNIKVTANKMPRPKLEKTKFSNKRSLKI